MPLINMVLGDGRMGHMIHSLFTGILFFTLHRHMDGTQVLGHWAGSVSGLFFFSCLHFSFWGGACT
jgi:hypothetical protein